MPKTIGGWIMLGLASFGTVVLGLAIYNRVKEAVPPLKTVTGEAA